MGDRSVWRRGRWPGSWNGPEWGIVEGWGFVGERGRVGTGFKVRPETA